MGGWRQLGQSGVVMVKNAAYGHVGEDVGDAIVL